MFIACLWNNDSAARWLIARGLGGIYFLEKILKKWNKNYAVYWLILWKPIQSNLNNNVQTSDNRIEKMFYNECINCSYWKSSNRNAGWHKPNIISASHKMFVIYNKERKNSSNTNIPNNHKTHTRK